MKTNTYGVSSGAERFGAMEDFIPMEDELHAHAVHCEIDSRVEKVLKAAESRFGETGFEQKQNDS